MNSQIIAPCIPDYAPFSKEQIGWLNGFLAGLYSTQAVGSPDFGASNAVAARPITILWGSQTGNTEGLAKEAAKSLKAKGFAPSVVDMGEYDKELLKDEELLLIMTSTYGDGEAPDNASELYDWVLSDGAPKLEKLRYSVLALGDSNYPDFCKCGIDFDERLQALGATQIAPRVDCDADFDESFESWLASLDAALGSEPTSDVGATATETIEKTSEFGKKNPFPAKVVDNRNLNGENSSKETRHVALSIAGSGLSYEPGDALAVLPMNSVGMVDELIEAAGFEPHELAPMPHGADRQLFEALRESYDISSLSSAFVLACARLTKSAELQEIVKDETKLAEYMEGRQMIDPILEFGVVFPTTEYLIAPLKQLQPRLYSISSSPNAHKDEVHVTVGVVRYDSHGRERKGVCSSFLAEQAIGTEVKVYFHASKTFKLPSNNDIPVIMVGPGTGIAPFRSFLEERRACEAQGDNWLFFGDQHASCDFLYSDELDTYLKDGTLTKLDTAFSRDQDEKVYVQNRMIEQGAELFAWLERGGCFYVCGDASRMAKDVDAALHQLIETHGGLSSSDAADYVKRLKSEKRYLRDVY